MSKRHINSKGRVSMQCLGEIYRENKRDSILSELSQKERREKGLTLGPKAILKQLLEKGYPEEEAIKSLKNQFQAFENEEEILQQWIKEIKTKSKNKQKGVSPDGR